MSDVTKKASFPPLAGHGVSMSNPIPHTDYGSRFLGNLSSKGDSFQVWERQRLMTSPSVMINEKHALTRRPQRPTGEVRLQQIFMAGALACRDLETIM